MLRSFVPFLNASSVPGSLDCSAWSETNYSKIFAAVSSSGGCFLYSRRNLISRSRCRPAFLDGLRVMEIMEDWLDFLAMGVLDYLYWSIDTPFATLFATLFDTDLPPIWTLFATGGVVLRQFQQRALNHTLPRWKQQGSGCAGICVFCVWSSFHDSKAI